MPPVQIAEVVEEVIRRRQLNGCLLVVAVSGGADSVALLLALADLRTRCQLRLHLAHFDHALRPDSELDAAWVAVLARQLEIEATIGRATGRRGDNAPADRSEAAARDARYRFLGDVATKLSATAVVVGHTQDDQVETRLLHVTRGSGLRGLRGMTEDSPVVVDGESIRVIRPFLGVDRRQTEAFCVERGVEPRRDPTNTDVGYARNRIRHNVVPQLGSINPRLANALDRLGKVAGDAEDFVDHELDRLGADLARVIDETWTIDRKHWRTLHRALKRALLRRAAHSMLPSRDVGADAIEAAIEAADSWPAGQCLAWPDGLVITIEHDRLSLGRAKGVEGNRGVIHLSYCQPTSLELSTSGWAGPHGLPAFDVPASGSPLLRIRPTATVCLGREEDRWHVDLDRATLGDESEFVLRSRQTGDWLSPEGMSGRKKLQDLFVDAHIPRSIRDQLPLIATSHGVAWVIGLRRDRRFIAHSGSAHVLCLDVIPGATEDNDSCSLDTTISPGY